MSPYYDDGVVTIYHGNAADLVDTLPHVSLVLTDPPYGIGSWSSSGGNSLTEAEANATNGWDVPPDGEVLRSLVALGDAAIVWGGNYLCADLGLWRTPLVWDKAIRGMHFADGELAWTNFTHGSLRIFNLPIAGVREPRLHPTQKPLALMSWCIQQAKPEATSVLDPFMGSGSTLVAAKSLGCTAIGVELDERYCEIAAQRCSQEVLALA